MLTEMISRNCPHICKETVPDGAVHGYEGNSKMNMNDKHSWKKFLENLQKTSEENSLILQEINDEIERQKEKRKQEIELAVSELQNQMSHFQQLLSKVQDDTLFLLSDDQEASDSLTRSLLNQAEKTRTLLEQAEDLLRHFEESQQPAANTESDSAEDERQVVRSRADKGRSITYLPKLFRKEHILGNWIHYFDNSTFTCQSFWDDGTFKEYDFEDNSMVGEREGTFDISEGSLLLNYESGKKDAYQITGFSDERIDYKIHGTSVQFDYMPESLLNNFLDASAQ